MATPKFPASEIQRILDKVATENPRARGLSHTSGHPERFDYMVIASTELAQASNNIVAGNWQRGIKGKFSMDGLSVLYTDAKWRFHDVIKGAGAAGSVVKFDAVDLSESLLRDAGGNYIGIEGAAFPDHPSFPKRVGVEGTKHNCKLGCSLFWAPAGYRNHRDRLSANLKWIREVLGAEYVRVMWKKGNRRADNVWAPHLSDDLSSLSVPFIAEVHDFIFAHGLKLQNTIFGDNEGMDTNGERELVRRMVEATRGRDHMVEFWEIFNEPYTRGGGHGGEMSMLKRNGKYLHSLLPNVLIALGAPKGPYTPELFTQHQVEEEICEMIEGWDHPKELQVLAIHVNRDINRPPDLGPCATPWLSNNEPRGPFSSARHSIDAVELATDMQVFADAGYGYYCSHWDAGIWSDLINPLYVRHDRGAWKNIFDMPNAEAIAAAQKKVREGGGVSGGVGGGGGNGKQPPTGTTDKLQAGERLLPETTLVSVGGQARLHYQSDGNLVVYLNDEPVWASQTSGQSAGSLEMQADGNLILKDADGLPLRATHTDGHPNAIVHLQDDGNFVIYDDPNGPNAGTPLWASATDEFFS